jgi:hypothetical protein
MHTDQDIVAVVYLREIPHCRARDDSLQLTVIVTQQHLAGPLIHRFNTRLCLDEVADDHWLGTRRSTMKAQKNYGAKCD